MRVGADSKTGEDVRANTTDENSKESRVKTQGPEVVGQFGLA
jgi:hypothetical protein